MNPVSLLEQLGGRESVRVVVTELYARLSVDPLVAPIFEDVDFERLRAHMVDFLVAALDGPDVYRGRELAAAHAGRDITDAMFDAVVAHLIDVLTGAGIAPATVSSVVERLAPLRADVCV